MKNKIFKYAFMAALAVGTLSGCVSDDDFALPEIQSPLFAERFSNVTPNALLEITDWTNFAQAGNVRWIGKTFSGNGYAEFSSFGSSDASNIGWLITPKIDLDTNEGKKLVFQTAQHHLSVAGNTLEVFTSTDFDGTNVAAATWVPVTGVTLATQADDWYAFVPSGEFDLSAIEGPFYVGFKANGNGTTQTAGFSVDNVAVFSSTNN